VGIVSWIVWGLFVGAFARLLLPGRQAIGCLWTIAVGVAGSIIGGLIATQVLEIADTDEFDLGSFFIAVGTSVLLLAIYERIAPKRDDDERDRERPRPPA
jgi:uncharacterized membrane protein YeaQ/YmgE (transglycosylase-associated protein family)